MNAIKVLIANDRIRFSNHSIIAAAKGAIQGLTVSFAAEFAPKIRFNCIAPSITDSPLAQGTVARNDEIKKALGSAHPIPR